MALNATDTNQTKSKVKNLGLISDLTNRLNSLPKVRKETLKDGKSYRTQYIGKRGELVGTVFHQDKFTSVIMGDGAKYFDYNDDNKIDIIFDSKGKNLTDSYGDTARKNEMLDNYY